MKENGSSRVETRTFVNLGTEANKLASALASEPRLSYVPGPSALLATKLVCLGELDKMRVFSGLTLW